MKIIALDPGGTTGVATTILSKQTNECSLIFTRQLTGAHHTDLYKYFINESPNVIVYERFIYQDRKKKVSLESVEYIGVAKLYTQLTNKQLAPQMAASAKNLWTDDKVKALGLWQPGQPHAMDAVRHLLLFVTDTLGIQQYVNQLRKVT